jgi:hypothetical protein
MIGPGYLAGLIRGSEGRERGLLGQLLAALAVWALGTTLALLAVPLLALWAALVVIL